MPESFGPVALPGGFERTRYGTCCALHYSEKVKIETPHMSNIHFGSDSLKLNHLTTLLGGDK